MASIRRYCNRGAKGIAGTEVELSVPGHVAYRLDASPHGLDMMGLQAPPELLAIHTNMPGIFPAEIDAAAFSGKPAPSGLSADEKVAYERLQFVYQKGIAYGFQMGLRPNIECGSGRGWPRQRLFSVVESMPFWCLFVPTLGWSHFSKCLI